jgi:hypothetical protein
MWLLENQVRRVIRAARRRLTSPPPPRRYHLWTIAMYMGAVPWQLSPAVAAERPALTREAVTDVPAYFVADPFMVRAGSGWYLFFEVMNGQSEKGEIGLAVSDDAMHWRYDSIVLSEAFHMSYPQVFAWGGDHYMIPETNRAGAVRLYRARRFPYDWEVAGVLLTGSHLSDASVFRSDERWWMFVETGGQPRFDVLRLYHAPDLTGPWVEHHQSPIVNGDTRLARPAGRVVTHEGRIIRFAQDVYPTYGTAVRALDVTRLTVDTYEERTIGGDPMLGPTGVGWNADGMHHVDAHLLPDGRWIACVDGWQAVPAYSERKGSSVSTALTT